MMGLSSSLIVLVCVVSSQMILSKPLSGLDFDALFSATGNLDQDNGNIAKRRVFDNQKRSFSLSELIGNVEQSLVQSALSVSGLAHNPNLKVQETVQVVSTSTDHALTKRATLPDDPVNGSPLILQTTERIPESNGVPAQVVVDRISVYSSPVDNIPLVPTFRFQNQKRESVTEKASSSSSEESTEKSAEKSAEKSSEETVKEETEETSTDKDETVSASSEVAPTPTPTTKSAISELEKAEEDLKEKVAEIEADPVILSARV